MVSALNIPSIKEIFLLIISTSLLMFEVNDEINC